MDPASLPNEELRRELAGLGIARERHCLGELIAMLPARLDGRPYEDFDADCVAEVLAYLVSKGVIDVPSPAGCASRNERCVWLAGARASDKARHEIASLADIHGSPEQIEVVDDAGSACNFPG